MRTILAVTVFVTAVLVGPSWARQVQESPSAHEGLLTAGEPLRRPTATRSTASHVPAKLVLPNIRALTLQLMRSDRTTASRQLVASRRVVAFFENHAWLRATRHHKCWEVAWQRSCTMARAVYRLHLTLAVAAQQKLWREFPLTNDWQTAVRIAQRAYPGTASWMLSISDREGGWSTWVWYGGRPWSGYHIGSDSTGDTVGGWMQFRYSTFAPYWRAAVQDLRARGFLIPNFPDRGGPDMYQPWLDPLGQALTAGYMRYYHRDGCHWCI